MWWRISLIAGCWITLPMNAMVDAMYECTIFHGTWFYLPLSTACSWLCGRTVAQGEQQPRWEATHSGGVKMLDWADFLCMGSR